MYDSIAIDVDDINKHLRKNVSFEMLNAKGKVPLCVFTSVSDLHTHTLTLKATIFYCDFYFISFLEITTV